MAEPKQDSERAYGVWRVTYPSTINTDRFVSLFVAEDLADLARQWAAYAGTGADYDDPDKIELIAHENADGADAQCAGFQYRRRHRGSAEELT